MARASLAPAVSQRHVAPESQRGGAGFAIDKDFPARARGRGHDAIVDAVVVGKRRNADEGAIAGAIGGQDIHENHIVIDGERGNRSAVRPHQIVLRPTFAVAFEGEIRIVSNDIAVHILHAFLGQRVGQLFEYANGMVIALGMQRVGQLAAGKIRIAASHQHQVSRETSVGVEGAVGFDRGVKSVVRPDQGHGRRGGEELGVGSGREQFVRIAGVKHLAGGKRNYFDAPEATRQVGRLENSGNAFVERFMRGGLQLRAQQQAQRKPRK